MAKRIREKINVIDLFSGIGGFSLGIEQSGINVGWTGFSEIDNHAAELYKRRFPNTKELGSDENVSYKKLKGKRIDLLTGGFPCQAFSVSGKRRGFKDSRGILFFEIARILKDYIENGKPIPCILLENVKGLLSHDSRQTFATIYEILTDLNYTLECQVVNTKWWIPQNRERIFIFGRYNGRPSGRKIFPVYGGSEKAHKLQGQYTNTITARYEAGATGSYIIESEQYAQKERKLKQIGNIDQKGHNSIWGRVYDTDGIASTLNSEGGGLSAKTGLYKVTTHSLYPRSGNPKQGGTGHLSKEDGTAYCLDTGNAQAIEVKSRIRRLTPIECERLQGFPDGWTDGQSDTQRYKQLGNAVSVPVTKAIFRKIYYEENTLC